MDIDAFKGNDKGKGKGKDKGKRDYGKNYPYVHPKGNDKGKGKGKDKGDGPKGGKADGKIHGYCGYCGKWGHRQSDCRSDPRNGGAGRPVAAAMADHPEAGQPVAAPGGPTKAGVGALNVVPHPPESSHARPTSSSSTTWMMGMFTSIMISAAAHTPDGDEMEALVDSGAGVSAALLT